jgi:anti-sigma B factor antagonist
LTDQAHGPILTLDVERKGSVALVRCHGRLVAGGRDILSAKVRELIPNSKRIILDLTDLTHMDSMGLGTLVRLYTSAKKSGCSLELINLGKQIRELLGVTNLLSVFTAMAEQGITIRL